MVFRDAGQTTSDESLPIKVDVRAKGIRDLVSKDECDFILDETGKLWGLDAVPWYFTGREVRANAQATEIHGLGWLVIASANRSQFMGIKADGSLWQSDTEYHGNSPCLTTGNSACEWIGSP